MPISRKRLAELELAKTRFTSTRNESTPLVIQFIGSMYSPRDEFLQIVQEKLAEKGITLTINSDKTGTSNDDYWRVLVESDIIFTTTLQGPTRRFMDWIWVRQAVFRYAETMAAGTALVAQCVEGGFPYFTKDSDYLEFVGVDQAVAEITALVSDPELRRQIAESGHATMARYVEESVFWKDVIKCCQLHRTSRRTPGIFKASAPNQTRSLRRGVRRINTSRLNLKPNARSNCGRGT